jgi:hypothetical protein
MDEELKPEDINKLQRAGFVCKSALEYIIPKTLELNNAII